MGFQGDVGDGERGTDDIDLGSIVLGRYAGVLVAHGGMKEQCCWPARMACVYRSSVQDTAQTAKGSEGSTSEHKWTHLCKN